MLTIDQVARHYSLSNSTVERRIKSGELHARRFNRMLRLTWEDVWTCERGPRPRGRLRERYKTDLKTKADVACAATVCTRTVERWIEDGLPTRCVFGSVRLNQHDVDDWLAQKYGFELEWGEP
ncbi:hypothetical protein B6V74_09550 [Thioclava sp. F42-5]|nr:hypothetical protein B6V74_09550 [Thioclava sp. F42-5]